jgi:hypothetical protein
VSFAFIPSLINRDLVSGGWILSNENVEEYLLTRHR